MPRYLRGTVAIVADDNDTVAAIEQLAPASEIARSLRWLVMYRAIAEHANIRLLEKVRDVGRLANRALGLVQQSAMTRCEDIEKAAPAPNGSR